MGNSRSSLQLQPEDIIAIQVCTAALFLELTASCFCLLLFLNFILGYINLMDLLLMPIPLICLMVLMLMNILIIQFLIMLF